MGLDAADRSGTLPRRGHLPAAEIQAARIVLRQHPALEHGELRPPPSASTARLSSVPRTAAIVPLLVKRVGRSLQRTT